MKKMKVWRKKKRFFMYYRRINKYKTHQKYRKRVKIQPEQSQYLFQESGEDFIVDIK
jgi:protease II